MKLNDVVDTNQAKGNTLGVKVKLNIVVVKRVAYLPDCVNDIGIRNAPRVGLNSSPLKEGRDDLFVPNSAIVARRRQSIVRGFQSPGFWCRRS